MPLFSRIGFALAFSPTAEAMLAETARWAKLFQAELVLMHIGPHGEREEHSLREILKNVDLSNQTYKIIWEEGEPADKILKVCDHQQIDLLIAGALKKENLVSYYVGTIARKIMRKANCSLMMIANPSVELHPLKNIVVNAEDSPFLEEALSAACQIASKEENAWVHIVRELKLLGLALAATDQHSEQEYAEVKQHLLKDEIIEVEKMLGRIPHDQIKVNIKMLSGKSGFELCKFAERKQADLLIVGSPAKRFSLFDRVFPHDLEYVFAEMPCNLLIVHPREKDHKE